MEREFDISGEYTIYTVYDVKRDAETFLRLAAVRAAAVRFNAL